MTASATVRAPGASELRALFERKYGDPNRVGWGPRARWRAGYFTPEDHYEALVESLVGPETRWLDVGGGRNLLPSNPALSLELASRCRRLVGVDPDETIDENRIVHERCRAFIESAPLEGPFDLVSMRMVAEHVERPAEALAAIRRLTAPGGRLVIYTVSRWSPAALVARAVPERLQNTVKNWFWATDAKDTFPVRYRMNTRRALARVCGEAGFREALFLRLDDCRSLSGYRSLQAAELGLWRAMRAVGIGYPEACLLGVYVLDP